MDSVPTPGAFDLLASPCLHDPPPWRGSLSSFLKRPNDNNVRATFAPVSLQITTKYPRPPPPSAAHRCIPHTPVPRPPILLPTTQVHKRTGNNPQQSQTNDKPLSQPLRSSAYLLSITPPPAITHSPRLPLPILPSFSFCIRETSPGPAHPPSRHQHPHQVTMQERTHETALCNEARLTSGSY